MEQQKLATTSRLDDAGATQRPWGAIQNKLIGVGRTQFERAALVGDSIMADHSNAGDTPDRLRQGAKRALFATSLLFTPVPFYAVFVAGLVPLPWIAVGGGIGALGILPKSVESPANVGIFLFLLTLLTALLAIEAGILYALASGICRMLFWLCPARAAVGVVGFLIVAQVIAGLFPIYVVVEGGGMDIEWVHLSYLNVWRPWVE